MPLAAACGSAAESPALSEAAAARPALFAPLHTPELGVHEGAPHWDPPGFAPNFAILPEEDAGTPDAAVAAADGGQLIFDAATLSDLVGSASGYTFKQGVSPNFISTINGDQLGFCCQPIGDPIRYLLAQRPLTLDFPFFGRIIPRGSTITLSSMGELFLSSSTTAGGLISAGTAGLFWDFGVIPAGSTASGDASKFTFGTTAYPGGPGEPTDAETFQLTIAATGLIQARYSQTDPNGVYSLGSGWVTVEDPTRSEQLRANEATWFNVATFYPSNLAYGEIVTLASDPAPALVLSPIGAGGIGGPPAPVFMLGAVIENLGPGPDVATVQLIISPPGAGPLFGNFGIDAYPLDTQSVALAAGSSAVVSMRLDTLGLAAGMPFQVQLATSNSFDDGDQYYDLGTLQVVNFLGNITITTPTSLPGAAVGRPYAEQLAETGAPRATWSTSTILPPGLSLSPAGLLSGTPSQAGSFVLTIQAAEANYQGDTRAFQLTAH
jgi:hypothetical protein